MSRSLPARLHLEELEPRLVPAMRFGGGALLPSVEVQAIYYGSHWTSNTILQNEQRSLESFLQGVVNSSYMDALTTAGYHVGRGSFDTGLALPANLSHTQDLQSTKIESDLQAQIDAGALASPDSNRLYIVFVEDNIVTIADGQSSATDFAGIHLDFQGHDAHGASVDIPYAIIPYPDGPPDAATLDSITATTSHELAEAATDPFGTGWTDPHHGGSEIGDLSQGFSVYLNGFAVQRLANQRDLPMTPAGAGAKQDVSFVLQNDHQLVRYAAGVAPQVIDTDVASVSNQSIDAQGHAMIDYVTTDHRAFEYQDEVGLPNLLARHVQSAVSGQAVSYVLFRNGVLREWHDPTPDFSGFNTQARWTRIAKGIIAIDAGTDREGVSAVDVITHKGVAYQYADGRHRTLIAADAQSISAGQRGLSAYVDHAGHAFTFDATTGSTTDLAAGTVVAAALAGVDAQGNAQFEVLDTQGGGAEYASDGSVTSLGSGLLFLSKARGGLIDEVLQAGTARTRDDQGDLTDLNSGAPPALLAV
jgi:hypothetical protein